MSDRDIIVAQELAAGYGTKVIWHDASFTITAGEFVALLGPNGAGKTTLIRLLLGLYKPLTGTLKVFGRKPEKGNPRIGYVPQRRPVDEDVRIEALEFVRLGLSGTKWGVGLPKAGRQERQQAMEALLAVDAVSLAHRSLGELSGGELQRIFLAQALIGEPDLLLLDEPLANLDMRREANFVDLINKVVRSRNVTVLLIA